MALHSSISFLNASRWNKLGDIENLLVNAQNSGAVRGDIGIQEVRRLLIGLVRSLDFHIAGEQDVLENLILVVSDGLKTR